MNRYVSVWVSSNIVFNGLVIHAPELHLGVLVEDTVEGKQSASIRWSGRLSAGPVGGRKSSGTVEADNLSQIPAYSI